MQFAIAMSLVMLTSTALLLYQFWMGSLAGDDSEAPLDADIPRSPDLRRAA